MSVATKKRVVGGRFVAIGPQGAAALARAQEDAERVGGLGGLARAAGFWKIVRSQGPGKYAANVIEFCDHVALTTLESVSIWGHGALDPDELTLDLQILENVSELLNVSAGSKTTATPSSFKRAMEAYGVHAQHKSYAKKYLARVSATWEAWPKVRGIWLDRNRHERVARLWSNSSPLNKLLYLQKATYDAVSRYSVESCGAVEQQLVARPFSLNLCHKVQASLASQKRGAISVVSRRMRDALTPCGTGVHYWAGLEISPSGNFHIHGVVVFRRGQYSVLEAALRRVGGAFEGRAAAYQLDFHKELVQSWTPPGCASPRSVIRTEARFRTDRVTTAWANYSIKSAGDTYEALSRLYPSKRRHQLFTCDRALLEHAQGLFRSDVFLFSEFCDKAKHLLAGSAGRPGASRAVKMIGDEVERCLEPLVH